MRFIPFVAVVALLAGCNGDRLPPEADPAQGRQALKTVLDSWVNGGKAEDLKAGKPPIHAFDPDWAAGYQLVKYEVDPTDRRVGVDLLLSVKLTVKKGDDKPREKTVNFSVAIGQYTVVLRQT
jgi:hypothetical protein